MDRPVDTAELKEFYAEVERKHLAPLWNVTANLLPREPRTKLLPYLALSTFSTVLGPTA